MIGVQALYVLLLLLSYVSMEKNRGCVCENGRNVAENGYSGEITQIAADAL